MTFVSNHPNLKHFKLVILTKLGEWYNTLREFSCNCNGGDFFFYFFIF